MSDAQVVVVIPVHDEELLLERCLRSVDAAVRSARAASRVIVVLDDCRDGSAEIAARCGVEVLRVDERSVGAARRAGVAYALRTCNARTPPEWLANTDADSEVPPHWLTHQLSLMRAGADLMLGTVRPDFADLEPRHVAHWEATHRDGSALGNVHGANLGIRMSAYLRCGGFAAVPEHEDALLVERARALGAVAIATDACEVRTSGRQVGRTPGGYAAHVRATAESLAEEAMA